MTDSAAQLDEEPSLPDLEDIHQDPLFEGRQRSYSSFSHRVVAQVLSNVQATGVLGSGRPDNLLSDSNVIRSLYHSLPWRMLLAQAVWSFIVTMIVYALADKSLSTLSEAFWTPSRAQFRISSSVVFGIGWALFVLLAFFVREASRRHRDASFYWAQLSSLLSMIVRHIAQVYPRGTWHRADHDRILGHLLAYPIALKMSLREEREAAQLESFLHPTDVNDVIHANEMHVHCMSVVRSYFACAESDSHAGFKPANPVTPAGPAGRFFSVQLVDNIDFAANSISRIAQFRPAYGYANHLRLFLGLWLAFLPLALIGTSGWFTVLFAVLITYGVGMLFFIAMNLNEPYGYDIQDLKLNSIAAGAALNALNIYSVEESALKKLITPQHDTPKWLENALSESSQKEDDGHKRNPIMSSMMNMLNQVRISSTKRNVAIPLVIFTVWTTSIVFLTWGIARKQGNNEPDCRWWCLYLPVDTSTTAYVGLGLFLSLGFWLNDSYDRYWEGIQLWHTSMRSILHRLVFQIVFCCKPGTWHDRDIERLLSHIVALPYVAKMKLRESRDLTEISDILSPQDTRALAEADDLPAHCLRVIFAYLNSIDRKDQDTLASGKRPVNMSMFTMIIAAWNLESNVVRNWSVRKFPISQSFTTHLQLFAMFWMAILPLPLVEHDGFFSLFYLPLIAYSIIKLFDLGKELSDPFGCDTNDVPLDALCRELKREVHSIYRETKDGPKSIVHEADYTEQQFLAAVPEQRFCKWEQEKATEQRAPLTWQHVLRTFVNYFPAVSLRVLLAVIVWMVVAVCGSYGLSFVWEEKRRKSSQCRTWCSPIDVEETVPLELGFALFVLLSFRASDAMERYQEGASYLHQLGSQLRVLLMEITQGYERGVWHKLDKERLAAHFIQIPLILRNELLHSSKRSRDRDGLLSDKDRTVCEGSPDPIRYCIQIIEGYILALDTPGSEWEYKGAKHTRPSNTLVFTMIARVGEIANSVERIRGIRKFSVVPSYTSHQRVLTGLWLMLLPFSMTARTGFFTLLWAPLVSYGILALENVATILADPFGCNVHDLPTKKVTGDIVNSLLDAVRSAEWDYHHHVTPSARTGEPALGSVLNGTVVQNKVNLPFVSSGNISPESFATRPATIFRAPQKKRSKPGLVAHVLLSVPWWVLFMVSAWTAIGVIISYVTRTDSSKERWWESRISIDDMVATYVGFPTFMLLGFYVQAAFGRHGEAGNVWGDHLRAACHTLALQWISLSQPGTWHEGDHERVIGHIASIPLAMKMELRGERDVRELKGLLSEQDLGRLLLAESMTTHCIDVIRSYYFAGQCRPESVSDSSKFITDFRKSFIKFELQNLENAIRRCKFIKRFRIAPAIIVLLRTLLGIWFIVLPFVFAETAGWFSILWVPVTAYGLLGMLEIAHELQDPFGNDLNDLDLDDMAQEIVQDVLFVYRKHRGTVDNLIVGGEQIEDAWKHVEEDEDEESNIRDLIPMLDRDDYKVELTFKRPLLHMALRAVPIWVLACVNLWSVVSVTAAWVVHRYWPMEEGLDCGPGFCSRIAVDAFVSEYVGFALFVLLGLRLGDSYARYQGAQTIWREGILGMTRLFSNRFFEAYPSGTFHPGDQERVAAHLAAFVIVTVARLRRKESSAGCLRHVLGAEDVKRVESAKEKGDYCLDVVRGYLNEADRKLKGHGPRPSGVFVHWMLFVYLRRLHESGSMCERIIRVALPFGYIEHTRIFLVIWLLLLPLGLVEYCGWYTIVWVFFIAYGVIGIERWSAELANPFGTDLSDIPLGEFRVKAYSLIKRNLRWYHEGNVTVVREDRPGLPVER